MKSLSVTSLIFTLFIATSAMANGEKEAQVQNQKLDLTHLEEIEEIPETDIEKIPSPAEEERLEQFRKLVEEAYQKLVEEL